VIVGVADAPLEHGRLGPGTVLSVQADVARAAVADAGLSLGDVDGLCTAGPWGFAPTLALSEYLGLQPRFSDGTQVGGSSFEFHVGHAARAIEAGDCEVALVVYGSRQRSDRGRTLGPRSNDLGGQYDAPYGLPTPVGAYALAATRHMHEYGTTSEQLAEIAVATRAWAALNPAAMYREPITVEDVLASEPISDPLRLLDCCLVTDGAGAVVLTTEENARAAGRTPVYVRGFGESQTHWSITRMPDLTVTPARESGKRALEQAGITHDDVDVTELYDSFTITVLLTLESLGFCGPGEGGAFVSGQRTAPGGEFPLNTNGGGLSCLHPGMYGIFLLIEAVRQLRGECGDRQVEGAKIALVNGTGGVLSSTGTCILANH
jgi:acetyl-CoA acetyltransferase